MFKKEKTTTTESSELRDMNKQNSSVSCVCVYFFFLVHLLIVCKGQKYEELSAVSETNPCREKGKLLGATQS